MIPAALIIETVCISQGVSAHEFNMRTRKQKIVQCQHLVVIKLLEHTRLSVHQVSYLLGYDLQRVYHAKKKLNNCVQDGVFHMKYRELTINIKKVCQ